MATSSERHHGVGKRLVIRMLVLALGATTASLGLASARASQCSSSLRGVLVEARRDGEVVELPQSLEQWDDVVYITPHDSGNGELSIVADPSVVLQLKGLRR